ncbi:response regulator [Ensifer sp. LCM 4579]|uniref:hybrid sensor histidine kinase/response regulator n=1 Tax=Ensifer sp. LCM 4579 TaxID=1848292 RepID=UPI0008DAD31B|nr:response regulator [Ensifer sp. LCM 4579]OHV79781.1 hybrid sensor histidine kinase/response regulator [Ensifer sp. LCM 4579]
MIKPEELDRQLLEMFTQEVRERAADIERMLIGIEEAGEPSDKRALQKRLLRTVHSLKGAAGLVEVRGVENICHWMEEVLATAGNEDRTLDPGQLDQLLRAADAIAETARQLARGETPATEQLESDILDMETTFPPADDDMDRQAVPSASRAELAVPVRSTDMDGSMRVSAERLDALLHRSGELLSWNAAMRRHADQASLLRETARRLHAHKARPERETASMESGLRALAASMRRDARLMHGALIALGQEVRHARTQPFAEACQGLTRVIRDMAAATGKAARLEVRGTEIEIDRSILAGLQDSLRHLVRNAIAHGIEPPAERRAAGKPECGLVTVSATVTGDRVQVVVEDDGRGLDPAALGKRFGDTESGLNGEGQLLQHVFKPGITTAPRVTKLSGRGIGLDIVRSAVEGMRGTATVARRAEAGTAFTLTLPLTLATVRALEVVASGHVFTIDTSSVERVIRLASHEIAVEEERVVATTRDGKLPVIDLAGWLGLRPTAAISAKASVPAVIIGTEGRQAAVLVDEVAGEQELLARSLGARLRNVRRYCGGMILPDGQIALLLNTAVLIEAAVERTAAPDTFPRPATLTSRRKVLVVDDSKYVRSLVRLILQGAGYDVAMAASGSEALAHLGEHGADIVVADVDMPNMDGFELTEAIRGSERLSAVPIVLFTGRETPEDRLHGLKLGASAYVTKSHFDAQQFLETVGRVG